jgi:hypothetical protein
MLHVIQRSQGAEGVEYDFAFDAHFAKAEDATDDRRLVCGMASADLRDSQGETVIQNGIDFKYLLERGVINWDHGKDPGSIIGEPIEASVVPIDSHPVMSKSGLHGHLGFWVKAFLYKGKRMADEAWEWLQVSAAQGTRKPGWSIQGRVVERNGPRIVKSEILHLALTHQPILTVSFAEIVKSMTTGSAGPALLEALNGRVTSVLWGEPCRKGCFDATARFRKGRSGALEHLTGCKGYTLNESAEFLKALITSRLAI